MIGELPLLVDADQELNTSVLGGLHTSFFLVFQEVEGYVPEPVPDQFQRVLDKAEKMANSLASCDQDYHAAAAKIYLGIAELLSWL